MCSRVEGDTSVLRDEGVADTYTVGCANVLYFMGVEC